MNNEPDVFRVSLVNCTATIINEIEVPKVTQKDIAITYFLCMVSDEQPRPDWGKINRAIVQRWCISGLERIKKMANAQYNKAKRAAAS